MPIILASASPQRKKLLEQIGLEFIVIPGMVDETMAEGLPPEEQVKAIALKKAQWVAEAVETRQCLVSTKVNVGGNLQPSSAGGGSSAASAASYSLQPAIIIGADTIVVYGDKILGKPHNTEEAEEMLRLLSGTTHRVLTGLAVITPTRTLLDVVSTEVIMKHLSEDELRNYLATGEPIGKAGAVCIQGIGAKFVRAINGCFYNVVGLPLARLVEMLEMAAEQESVANGSQV